MDQSPELQNFDDNTMAAEALGETALTVHKGLRDFLVPAEEVVLTPSETMALEQLLTGVEDEDQVSQLTLRFKGSLRRKHAHRAFLLSQRQTG